MSPVAALIQSPTRPRLPAVRAGQLVVAEVAAAAVFVAAFGPGWVIIGVSSLATALLVATFGRAGGQWWYEAVASQRRFRRRRRWSPALLAQLCRGVVRAGAERGVRLRRLDGEQALAAYATVATAAPPASGRPSQEQRFRDNHERAGGHARATEAGRLSTGSAV